MVRAITNALRGKLVWSRSVLRWLPECLAASAAVEPAFSACAYNLGHAYDCTIQPDTDKLWTAGHQTPEKRLPALLD